MERVHYSLLRYTNRLSIAYNTSGSPNTASLPPTSEAQWSLTAGSPIELSQTGYCYIVELVPWQCYWAMSFPTAPSGHLRTMPKLVTWVTWCNLITTDCLYGRKPRLWSIPFLRQGMHSPFPGSASIVLCTLHEEDCTHRMKILMWPSKDPVSPERLKEGIASSEDPVLARWPEVNVADEELQCMGGGHVRVGGCDHMTIHRGSLLCPNASDLQGQMEACWVFQAPALRSRMAMIEWLIDRPLSKCNVMSVKRVNTLRPLHWETLDCSLCLHYMENTLRWRVYTSQKSPKAQRVSICAWRRCC